MIEVALFRCGEEDWDRMRIDYALKQHEQWYLGDGVYGDGPAFRMDYYNSFVIQPMLVDIVKVVQHEEVDWGELKPKIDQRARRLDRKSTRLNSSHVAISYAVFCLKKKKFN